MTERRLDGGPPIEPTALDPMGIGTCTRVVEEMDPEPCCAEYARTGRQHDHNCEKALLGR